MLLAHCVEDGAEACRIGTALGRRSTRRELHRYNYHISLACSRRPRNPRLASSVLPSPLADTEQRGTEILADTVDKIYDRKLAATGRRAYEALKGFRCLQQRSYLSLALMPADLVSRAAGLREELEARPTIADRTRSRVQQELTDVAELSAAIDVAARADNILYKQVEILAGSSELRLGLENSSSGISRALAAVPRKPHSPPSPPPAAPPPLLRPASAGDDSPEEGAVGEAEEELVVPASSSSSPPGAQEEDDASFSPVAGTLHGACWQDRYMARAHFCAGTFSSPWASAKYHFQKHASHLEGATIAAYIERALALRAGWREGVQSGQAWRASDVVNAGQRVRVMSTAVTWLVTTDDDNGKIISYRDRSGRHFLPVD